MQRESFSKMDLFVNIGTEQHFESVWKQHAQKMITTIISTTRIMQPDDKLDGLNKNKEERLKVTAFLRNENFFLQLGEIWFSWCTCYCGRCIFTFTKWGLPRPSVLV